MIITFLGTGTSQGVPVIACKCDVCLSNHLKDKRLRSSVMLEVDSQIFIIDTGPDFRQQMLREDIQNIDAIIYTHSHKDHVAGLDDIRAYNYKTKKDMELYCSSNVQSALIREFPYVFESKKYPGVPEVNINKINNNIFYINKTKITPIKATHYKMPVFGYRIYDFVYLTDVNHINDVEKQKMKNADLIVLGSLRKEKHISHFSLNEAVTLLKELRPKRALLTHISHLMGKHEKVNQELPDFISLSYDRLSIML
ncbi:MAG: MBL fold metallo-hydrolase [Bacteroidota bacterium]|nr:MBL fold metallo-hydrolase [Bacteroidota bacterium]